MSSELAPFVAAVLRDQVVEDLEKERDEARKALKEVKDGFFKIEITGENGTPVYASGNFEEGFYRNFYKVFNSSPDEWACHLETQLKCPLKDLRFVEIRLAGDVKLAWQTADENIWCEIGSENNAKNPEAKDLEFLMNDGQQEVSRLCVDVYNWQEADWRPRLDSYQGVDNTWQYRMSQALETLEGLQNAHECEVKMTTISFDIELNDSLIKKALTMFDKDGMKSKERQERRQVAEALHECIEATEVSECQEMYILDILAEMAIKSVGSDLELVLPVLVEAFATSRQYTCDYELRHAEGEGWNRTKGSIKNTNTDIFPLALDDPQRKQKLEIFVARLWAMNQQRQQARLAEAENPNHVGHP